MAKDESTPAESADAKPAKAPGKRRLLWIGLAIVILMLGGGGAGLYWMKSQAAGTEPAEAEVEEEEAHPAVIPFDSFVVNLADSGGRRFLRVSLSLVVNDEESAAALEDPVTKVRVRSAILELLAMQSADPLTTPEGKTTLKQSIAQHTREAAEHVKVTDVFFSEFIVQF